MRGVPDPGHAERGLGDSAHGDDAATRGEELEERAGRLDLVGPRSAVGRRLAEPVRVRRHDVPEQHVLLEAELVEHAVDDRRRRLRGPASRQLALGGERDAADPRAAVAGRLSDEQELGFRAPLEVVGEPLPELCRDAAYWLYVEPICAAARRWIKTRARAPRV